MSLQSYESAFLATQHPLKNSRCPRGTNKPIGLEEEVLMPGLGAISSRDLFNGRKNAPASSIQEDGVRSKLFQKDRWNQNKCSLVKNNNNNKPLLRSQIVHPKSKVAFLSDSI